MEIERRHVLQQLELVEVSVRLQRRNVASAWDHCRAQAVLVPYGHLERLHQRASVLAEALLARDERIAVMPVLDLPLLEVVGEADVVMRCQQQACAFAPKPGADRFDLRLRCLLVRRQVIEPEHHQRVRVGENPLVDRQRITRLIHALEHGHRMAGHLARRLLKAQRRAMEQLQRAGDSLQEVGAAPLRALVGRPRDPSDLGHRRESIVHLRDVATRLPRIAPSPINADPPLAGRVLASDVILVVSASRLNVSHTRRVLRSCVIRWCTASRRGLRDVAGLSSRAEKSTRRRGTS